jgi:hypothetical protein
MTIRFRFILACVALIIAPFGMAAEVVFREPFTLRLHVDEAHYYEAAVAPVPYVHEGTIYLFSGETFGVDLGLSDGVITGISYVPAFEKADLAFEFRQEIMDGKPMMLLKITTRTPARIFMSALMTIPERQGILETSILPIEPGLSNFESWPHPIVQLALHELRATP